MTDEQRIAKTLTDIANILNPCIQFTWDSPELNSDNKLPVLDLKLWIETDIDGKQYMQFTFSKKPVASKFTILKRSALSYKTKKHTLFQEALRQINNIGPKLPWDETIKHMNEYSYMLYLSGYSSKERYSNIKGALERAELLTMR